MTNRPDENKRSKPVARLLVADDEESMRYFLKRSLERRGFSVETAAGGDEAIRLIGERSFDLAVVDLKMPGADGIEVLAGARAADPEAMVIIMTAYGTVRSAVDAMRKGAFDYITKPFENEELFLLIDRALAQRATLRENRELRQIVDNRSAYAGLVGQSRAMRAVYQTIDMLAESSATVLITGESGTGKELVARAVHFHSRRPRGEIVAINCAAVPDSLVENELFGHESGAFTGAGERKRGLVARADGGTLFLDEISEITPGSQVKLLRFLQEREYTPLGSTEPVSVDLRVIAATNRDLEAAVEEGSFRQDLFWRLKVVPITLPPLRRRREDIPVLVSHFLEQYRKPSEPAPKEIDLDAMMLLTNYSWPGNVRELQNTIERMVVMNADRETLGVEEIPASLRDNSRADHRKFLPDSSMPYKKALRVYELDYVPDLLEQTGGNISKAAEQAGLSRKHLYEKIKKLGLDPNSFRK